MMHLIYYFACIRSYPILIHPNLQTVINKNSKIQMAISIIYHLPKILFVYPLILLKQAACITSPQNASQPQTQSLLKSQPISNLILIAISFLIIIVELFVWRAQIRSRNIVHFSAFGKNQEFQITSGKSQSNQIFTQKNQPEPVQSAQASPSRDQSPGIKTIKAMTANNSQQNESKKRRKRKADKLSDRRQRQEKQKQKQEQI